MELYLEDTRPDYVNAFAVTEDDPRDIQRKALAVLERAYKRRAAIPEPGSYWEEPEFHGSGREISLRRRRRDEEDVTGQWARAPMRLPPLPEKTWGVGATLAVGGLIVGTGVLIWYLWKRHQETKATQVGAEEDGFELLGEDS